MADRISGRGVELGSISVDVEGGSDLSSFVRRSLLLDLSGTLTLGHYATLERLFA